MQTTFRNHPTTTTAWRSVGEVLRLRGCRVAGRATCNYLRCGFSLVELLMVVAVIGILAVLALRVTGGLMGQAKVSATTATILRVQGLLDERMQATMRRLDQATELSLLGPDYDKIFGTGSLNNLSATASYDKGLTLVLARKNILRRVFPQRYEDTGVTRPEPPNSAESAELLYAALTSAPVFGIAPVPTDYFATSEVGDTDADGRPEFIDAWGQPLRFYRWPTRLIRPAGFPFSGGEPVAVPPVPSSLGPAALLNSSLPTGAALNTDPDDPRGLTARPKWSGAAVFESGTVGNYSDAYHTLRTYHQALLVSCGPDGALGLNEPTDTADFGFLAKFPFDPNNPGVILPAALDALTDNITNLNIRAGGK